MDHHIIGKHFPESYARRQRQYAHALLAQLRRDGDDSPEHVERMLKLARSAALDIASSTKHLAPYILLRQPRPQHLLEPLHLAQLYQALKPKH
jgi:hypothetical protein